MIRQLSVLVVVYYKYIHTMKKITLTVFVFCLGFLFMFTPISTALAISKSTEQNITVFHPDDSKTVTMGREIFTYQTFDSDTDRAISKIEITQPSEYEGLLLKKHIVQSPEDIYIKKGDFEFVFSQSEQKTKVSEGDIVSIPSGLPFGFRHIAKGEGKVLVVSRSDALPKMLAEVGTPVTNSSTILDSTQTPNFSKISSAAKKYGIEFLN